MARAAMGQLQDRVAGQVIADGDPGYDERARSTTR
jgi:hypothetical protein